MGQRYTAAQFIAAIKGSGGVISAIADAVGCSWHTARKYIDQYPTVKEAWENERQRITDRARHNIIKSIGEGDLQMSKWWLQVMDPEFVERNRTEVSGPQGRPVEVNTVELTDDERAGRIAAILDAARARRDRPAGDE